MSLENPCDWKSVVKPTFRKISRKVYIAVHWLVSSMCELRPGTSRAGDSSSLQYGAQFTHRGPVEPLYRHYERFSILSLILALLNQPCGGFEHAT